MKLCYIVLPLSILVVVLYSACEKKDTDRQAVIPAADSIKQSTTQTFPRTDSSTFYYTGLLINNMQNDSPPGLCDTDNVYVFYVTRIAHDSIKFTSSEGVINIAYTSGLDIITAQFKVNDSNSYYYPFDDGYSTDAYYSFRISNGILSARWHYQRPMTGTCDYGYCNGYFTGVKQ